MKNFAEKVFNDVFETNEKGQLKQNVRNAFKVDVVNALIETLENAGVKTYRTLDGVAVEFENVELGAITVVFDATVKALDFDAVTENEAFLENEKAKAEKIVKAEALKAQKIAEKEMLKAKIAEKKAK